LSKKSGRSDLRAFRAEQGVKTLLCLLLFATACGGEKPALETQYYAEFRGGGVQARRAAKSLVDTIEAHWASAQRTSPGVPDIDVSVLKFVTERMTLDAIAEWIVTDKTKAGEMKRRADLFNKEPSDAHMFECLGYMADNLPAGRLDTHARIAVSSAILRIKNR
jgi:hypothetical protein